jgi:uroporphyrin-III C-methyltransferase/precorrin-2 dehydrogenase/sirohydrochlorin ferrochelatase
LVKHPVYLDLRDQSVIVVGGGEVVERKVAGLLESGARLTVVSPAVTRAIEEWAEGGRIRIERRPYRTGDLRDASLAFVATNDQAVSQAVRQEADVEGVWINVADQPDLCDFFVPAAVRRGELTIAVSTNGASPALARRIREELERQFGPEYAVALERLRALRDRCRAERGNPIGERERYGQIVDSLLPCRDGGAPTQNTAKVFLVGAGPGDPDLLTLKGKRCLESSDVVVYDALVDRRILDHCRSGATLIYAGKRHGRHSRSQAEINTILVNEARAGRTVTRLKGGDPFVFSRGGEEAQALADAGIAYEIVPGVSAGIGVPIYAGIPLTHRDLSSEVTFLTGHESDGKKEPTIKWERHARGSGTLVIFMGLRNLRNIADALIDHGRDRNCPVAVIQSGTTQSQITVVGTLEDIADRVEAVGLEPPALVVVGEVVRLRERLHWFHETGFLYKDALEEAVETPPSEERQEALS